MFNPSEALPQEELSATIFCDFVLHPLNRVTFMHMFAM